MARAVWGKAVLKQPAAAESISKKKVVSWRDHLRNCEAQMGLWQDIPHFQPKGPSASSQPGTSHQNSAP